MVLYKKVFIAFLCGCIAILLWLSVTLSRTYRVNIAIPYKLIYPETSYLILDPKHQNLSLEIEGSGFDVFRQLFFRKQDTFNIPLELSMGVFQANLTEQLDYFKSKFPPKITPIAITPNKVAYTPQQVGRKQVPLVFRSNIDLFPYYGFIVEPQTIPDSIWIYGTNSRLERINEWETQCFSLNNVVSNFQEKVALAHNPYPDLNIENRDVLAQGVIGKYTEEVIERNITVVNIPDSLKLHLVPNTVKVYYRTPLAKYEQIKPDNFEVIIDYQRIGEDVTNATPEVFSRDNKVRNIRVVPQRIYTGVRKVK